MPLDDLVSVIETLRERIRVHGASLRENEYRTRMALIDPLLQALGWDTADPALVTPEYDVSGLRADYALLAHDGKPAATVEAKKLGEPLDSHRMQMLNYSNASDVEYAGLTDGNRWELYGVFQRGQLEDRRILNVTIAETPVHQCALQLLLLWRPNLASGPPVAAREPLIGMAPTQPGSVGTPLAPQTPTPITPPPVGDGWKTLAEYPLPSGTPHPQAIRFPDSKEHAIRYWYEVLTATVEWLVTGGLLTEGDIPFKTTRGQYLVNTQPINANGRVFARYRTIPGGALAVNTYLNTPQVIDNCKTLLTHCNQDPNQVYLQIGH